MKLKVVQYGVGKMSKYTMTYALEKGYSIVGAFDIDPKKHGIDISEFMETNKKYNVKIQPVEMFEEFLISKKPDIVIITTMSLLCDVFHSLKICAKCGVNAITTCEEAFFPQNSNPSLTKELDTLAKENNCTITGSGYQDVFWGNLISDIAGATHNIKRIVGKSSYNVEDYGIALARAHGAGLSVEEFKDTVASTDNISEKERSNLIKQGKFLPSYMWNVNGWLANKLNLDITSQKQECVPHLAKTAQSSTTLGMKIPKGNVTGMSAVVTSTTKQGIILQTECIGKVYSKTEFDSNEWTIEGEPTTTITINRPQTVELTCATVINRLVDVVNAKPGYIPTSHFPQPKFISK